MPRHLPFKHAHDLINYLSVNFFDATLNGNAEAFERLTPETVGALPALLAQVVRRYFQYNGRPEHQRDRRQSHALPIANVRRIFFVSRLSSRYLFATFAR